MQLGSFVPSQVSRFAPSASCRSCGFAPACVHLRTAVRGGLLALSSPLGQFGDVAYFSSTKRKLRSSHLPSLLFCVLPSPRSQLPLLRVVRFCPFSPHPLLPCWPALFLFSIYLRRVRFFIQVLFFLSRLPAAPLCQLPCARRGSGEQAAGCDAANQTKHMLFLEGFRLRYKRQVRSKTTYLYIVSYMCTRSAGAGPFEWNR